MRPGIEPAASRRACPESTISRIATNAGSKLRAPAAISAYPVSLATSDIVWHLPASLQTAFRRRRRAFRAPPRFGTCSACHLSGGAIQIAQPSRRGQSASSDSYASPPKRLGTTLPRPGRGSADATISTLKFARAPDRMPPPAMPSPATADTRCSKFRRQCSKFTHPSRHLRLGDHRSLRRGDGHQLRR